MEEHNSPTPPRIPQPNPGEWNQFARQAAIVLLILGLLVLFRALRPMLDMLAVTGLFILVLTYPVNAVRARTKMSYPVAALVVFIPLAILVLIFYGRMLQWSVVNAEALSNALQTPTALTNSLDAFLARLVGGGSSGRPIVEDLAAQFNGRLSFTAEFITMTGVSFLLAFLFILEMPSNLAHSFNGLSDVGQREIGILFDRLSKVWGGWLRSTGITSVIVGATTAFELWLFGIPYAAPLGVIAGFLNLIPTVGPFITYILIILVTYTMGSTRISLSPAALTLLVWGVNILVNQFIRLYIYPRLAGKALHLPVFLVILGIVVAVVLWGIIGVILVVPLLGSVAELLRFLLAKINGKDPYPGEELQPGFWAKELTEQ